MRSIDLPKKTIDNIEISGGLPHLAYKQRHSLSLPKFMCAGEPLQ
jgi:hypothetical protein